jgi:hypothetical protein
LLIDAIGRKAPEVSMSAMPPSCIPSYGENFACVKRKMYISCIGNEGGAGG